MPARPHPWVLIAGGFHYRGGMDKANSALAVHLAERGHPVHLVAFEVAPSIAAMRGVKVYPVEKPAGSYFLGDWLLGRRGAEVARAVTAARPDTRTVVNGGNCAWPDANWVHAVHRVWPVRDEGAPAWFRAKSRIDKTVARHRERRAIAAARIMIANSEKTRRELIAMPGVPAHRVFTCYPGCDPDTRPVTPEARLAARARLGLTAGRPLAIFVGTLGHDLNKGFDTLFSAWLRLCARPDWDVDLIAVGGGRGAERWGRLVERAGLAGRVTIVGYSDKVPELIEAADLLVSPVRYEAYGLNVHEALCRGVPAIVSASAGIAERYPNELAELILRDPESIEELGERLAGWRMRMAELSHLTQPFGARVRERTWDDMAREMVELIESQSGS